MSEAPNRIFAKVRPFGRGVDTTTDPNAYWPDLEFALNTPKAMQEAGYVPVDDLNAAIEEAARIVDPAGNAKDGGWANNLRKKAAKIRALKVIPDG